MLLVSLRTNKYNQIQKLDASLVLDADKILVILRRNQLTLTKTSRKHNSLSLSLWEKLNYLRFSSKFYPVIITSQGFQICNDFFALSLFFLRYSENLVFRFFLTVHIFEFLIMPFLQCLKSSSMGIRICLNFFHILHH